MSLNYFSPMKWVTVKNNYLKLNRSPLKLKWTRRTVKLNKGVDCKIKEIPETSERGPVPQLGVCPDLIVQLNFAFPEFSFAHPQNVELSKSQSSTWHNANKIEIKPQKSEYHAIDLLWTNWCKLLYSYLKLRRIEQHPCSTKFSTL